MLPFSEADVRVIAASFAKTIAEERYTCYACALMDDHVHCLIRKHRDSAEDMLGKLQAYSATALIDAGQRPEDHRVWGGPGWKRFLYTREDIERVNRYIEQNPIRAGKPAQRWPFVKPYNGWLPGNYRPR